MPGEVARINDVEVYPVTSYPDDVPNWTKCCEVPFELIPLNPICILLTQLGIPVNGILVPLVVACAVPATNGCTLLPLTNKLLLMVTAALASTVNPVTPLVCNCSTPLASAVCTKPAVEVVDALIMLAMIYAVYVPDVVKVCMVYPLSKVIVPPVPFCGPK